MKIKAFRDENLTIVLIDLEFMDFLRSICSLGHHSTNRTFKLDVYITVSAYFTSLNSLLSNILLNLDRLKLLSK
jgi:hypothetical protein